MNAAMSPSWPEFWALVTADLARRHCADGTRQQYRAILRRFYRFCRCAPSEVTSRTVREYLYHLNDQHYTASWMAMNISVIRACFDHVHGAVVTRGLVTPKRPYALPEILNHEEVAALLGAGRTLRDQLVMGLLYGCGLKPGELCRLTWRDIDLQRKELRVPVPRARLSGAEPDGERRLPIPPALLDVLREGVAQCTPESPVFQGRLALTHLSVRMVERIVREASRRAGILKPVTAMTLRHTFAVHALRAGWSIRKVQEALGHRTVETTLRYRRCTPPRVTLPVQLGADPDASPPSPFPPPTELKLSRPVTLTALALPFGSSLLTRAEQFYHRVTQQLGRRFLASRGPG